MPGPSGTLVMCGSQLQSHTYSCHFIHKIWELLPQVSPHLLYSNSQPAHPEPRRRSSFLSFHVSLKSNISCGLNWFRGNAELAHSTGRNRNGLAKPCSCLTRGDGEILLDFCPWSKLLRHHTLSGFDPIWDHHSQNTRSYGVDQHSQSVASESDGFRAVYTHWGLWQ